MLCKNDFAFLARLAPFMPPFGAPVTFLDAGANIGLASIRFAQFIGLTGQVLSVEAFPDTANMTEVNTAHLGSTVKVVRGALVSETRAATSSTVAVSAEATDFWASRVSDLFTSGRESSTQQVPVVSLRQLQV